ncbi:MAG: hypothetical protein LBV67_09720, partial [Streptococcaceae bacterium]|nr:hypothetical protein [Streptococcaceae bacterium]
KKEAHVKAAKRRNYLSKMQEEIQAQLFEIEEEHPSLLGSARKKDKEPSKIGLIFFVVCLVLASVSVTLLPAPVNFITSIIIIAIGTAVAYLVGVNNRKNFLSTVRTRWDELANELEEVEQELEQINSLIGEPVEEEVKPDLAQEEIIEVNTNIQSSRDFIQELYYEKQEMLYAKHRFEQDTSLDDLYQQKEKLAGQIRQLLLEYATKKTKARFIDKLLGNLSQNELPDLLEKASQILNILTNSEHKRILVDEQGFLIENKIGEKLPTVSLSTATKDQLILSIRLAYLMIGEKRMSPVVLDDGWLHYDTKRKRQLLQLFKDFGRFNQIIIFTSDIVMKQLFEKENMEITLL